MEGGTLPSSDQTLPAHPGRLVPLLAALAALVGYVATFAVAGNGCWLDLAAAAAGSAAVAWVLLTALLSFLPLPRRMTGVRRPAWLDACVSAAVSGGALFAAAAGLNLLVFRATGRETLNAHLTALLFLPVHLGLLLIADAVAAVAFLLSARRRGAAWWSALLWWAVAFNGFGWVLFTLLGRLQTG